MYDLSILIPARNEEFLAKTVENVLENIEADTEIIITLDGQWAVPPIPDNDRITILYHPKSVGQRAATNDAAKISKAKYVMKLDAHCAVAPGFDRILLEDIQDDWTIVPRMRNLHAFNWVCKECGHTRYQGKSGTCKECGGEEYKDVVWIAKTNPDSTSMYFDNNLKFGYWRAYKKKQKGDLVETMSLLGACWMLTREKYWELNICDEAHGSWGQQGTEVACKTWLSGGKLICNKRTWFAHMFRTQGGDFGFPYKLSSGAVNRARKYSRELWMPNGVTELPAWDKAIYSISWLLDKFKEVPTWEKYYGKTEEVGQDNTDSVDVDDSIDLTSITMDIDRKDDTALTKGIVYYTDNRLDPNIMRACQEQLLKSGLPIVSVSLKPIDFGNNIVLDLERGKLTMFKQILAGLEEINTDIVFFAEHDVLYHTSHFDFTPEKKDLFYYNNNLWKVSSQDFKYDEYEIKEGTALYHKSNHTSQLCAYRDLFLEHYRKRVFLVERDGFSRKMGFEPGTHKRKERVDDFWHDIWYSQIPNIDIRHNKNLTKSRWRINEFRNKKYTEGWKISEDVPGWGKTLGRFKEILEEVLDE